MTPPLARLSVHLVGQTDIGLARDHNEDAIHLDGATGLCVVADGFGGDAGSRAAATALADHFQAIAAVRGVTPDAQRAAEDFGVALRVADAHIARAGARVGSLDLRVNGLAAARFGEDVVDLVNVGDSRIYRLRGGVLEQLTQDAWGSFELPHCIHDPAEPEMPRRPRPLPLGSAGPIEAEIQRHPLCSGDVYLLATDGLMACQDDEIRSILLESPLLEDACKRLVNAVNQAGGDDNVTIALARVEPLDSATSPRARLLEGDAAPQSEPPAARLSAFVVASRSRRPCDPIDFFVSPAYGLLALAVTPGMTQEAGQRNLLAMDAVRENCRHAPEQVSVRVLKLEGVRREQYSPERLLASMQLANTRILEEGARESNQRPTSLGAVLLQGDVATIAHIGPDVAIVRVRAGRIERLAPGHEDEGRSLGQEKTARITARTERASPGDIFVLAEARRWADILSRTIAAHGERLDLALSVAAAAEWLDQGTRGIVGLFHAPAR